MGTWADDAIIGVFAIDSPQISADIYIWGAGAIIGVDALGIDVVANNEREQIGGLTEVQIG